MGRSFALNEIAVALLAAVLLLALPAISEDARAGMASPALDIESWRKKPPALPPPRPFVMPPVNAYRLSNGLRVELVEDHRVPFITVMLGIKAGGAMEPADLKGLADLTAGMLTEGAGKLSSRDIAEEIDFIGGGLRGSADYDYTTVVASSLSRYKERLFALLSAVVLKPAFPDSELRLMKTNLLHELKVKRSQPEFLQDERFARVLFGDHPYSSVAPPPEDVERITVGNLREFYRRHYLPNDAVLVVVGDFQPAQMRRLVEQSLGRGWQPGSMPAQPTASLPARSGRRIYLVDRPGSVQSAVKVGNVSIKRADPDYFPFLVANQILGGGAHARLFLNVREQKGYTYGAYSGFAARRDAGAFAAKADVRTDVTSPSLQEFLYEIERLRNVRVTDRELEDARRYLAGSFQLGLETQAGLAQKLLERRVFDLPEDYLQSYADRVMAVTADDVRRVARRHIDYDGLTIVVVGDADKIKSDLEYFAPVSVFDTDGRPRTPAGRAGALSPGS